LMEKIPMAVEYVCHQCGSQGLQEQYEEGEQVRCPKCGAMVIWKRGVLARPELTLVRA